MKACVLALFATIPLLPAQAIDPAKVIDLTHTFDANTIYWPTEKGFEWEKEVWGKTAGGYFYASAKFSSAEHGGTHIDSPLHFAEGKASVDQLTVQQLIGPAVVIDISTSCAKNPDYLASPQDLAAWEAAHGRIPAGSIVLFRTGWSAYWKNKKRYMGTDKAGDVAGLHFPGISPASAKVLLERRIRAVGIDTASIDYGQSKDFQVHRTLYAAGIYGLENVADLEKLPATGATLISLPMKIGGGTGGPVRIIAILP
ncbi:MAG: cyclase family protein [Acidobacteriota bacterium]